MLPEYIATIVRRPIDCGYQLWTTTSAAKFENSELGDPGVIFYLEMENRQPKISINLLNHTHEKYATLSYFLSILTDHFLSDDLGRISSGDVDKVSDDYLSKDQSFEARLEGLVLIVAIMFVKMYEQGDQINVVLAIPEGFNFNYVLGLLISEIGEVMRMQKIDDCLQS